MAKNSKAKTGPAELHVLKKLRLPNRYENLEPILGERVAQLLVQPPEKTLDLFRTAAVFVATQGQGLFLPICSPTGSGKTTLASSLTSFLPDSCCPTAKHDGIITADSLLQTARKAVESLKHDDVRVLPINIDHREGAPPSSAEMAEIKRFLRTPGLGSRVLILWPEISDENGKAMAADFNRIAGAGPVDLPIHPDGPDRDAWQDIALNTMKMCNEVDDLINLGVDPRDYVPAEFSSLGEFLKQIAIDFSKNTTALAASLKRPTSLVVVFVSQSLDHGVLSQLTYPSAFGLLQPEALVTATRESEIARWWKTRRGLLTQTVLKLNARAYCLPPHVTIAALRAFGPEKTVEKLKSLGVEHRGPKRVAEYITRSDLGKFLLGEAQGTFEARGRPPAPETSLAFSQLSDSGGFTLGKDKPLNIAMAQALSAFLGGASVAVECVKHETGLDYCALIPDNAVFLPEPRRDVVCIEYTWRKGDYLVSTNRSEIAQYALTKLKNYAIKLGWAEP